MSDRRGPSLLLPFSSKMETLLKSSCYSVRSTQNISEAARVMNQKKVDALVVIDNGFPKGIITESDLVKKGLAAGMAPDESVSKVMSSGIITIQKNQSIFDGLMLMIHHGIRHLVVLDNNNLAGIVSGHDWVTFQRRHPVVAIHEIEKAKTFEEIVKHKQQASGLARIIFEREGNAVSLVTLFSEINDRVTSRVIEIVLRNRKEAGKGDPPVSFAWIGMGSEGRKEQTVFTDQDNGIIYDIADGEDEPMIKNWFLDFAEEVVTGLEICGFPRCRGNIMATNPELCRSITEWKKLFSDIISTIDPERLLKASIYFDFRHLFGKKELSEELRESLTNRINVNRSFLRHLAGNMIASSRPPINSFRWRWRSFFNLSPPPFDIKRQALAPMVDAVRILALQCGSMKTNTLERLEDILEKEIMSKEMIDAARDAYDFMMMLRVRHDFSLQPDNSSRYDPKILNPLQKDFLKDALLGIYSLQSYTFFLIGGIDS